MKHEVFMAPGIIVCLTLPLCHAVILKSLIREWVSSAPACEHYASPMVGGDLGGLTTEALSVFIACSALGHSRFSLRRRCC